MKQLSSSAIRQMWLDFFKQKDHYELPSASLIPVDDKSLLWINSGVATLKPYFDGRKTSPAFRLTNSQKSIRTNDIENVGFTARHHTLFEMLGNFSIGDYFKKEAIEFAWEFLTSETWIGFDPNKLYVTVFEEDQEAYDIWLNNINIPEDKIIKGSRKTNFWDVGEGPCGPNTEIFYDRGEKYDPKNIGLDLLKQDLENDRYLEVWNIVFSQFNNDGTGNYHELPRKNIDTGAGLERIVSIIQQTPTNFETDLFIGIIEKTASLTNNTYQYDPNNFFELTINEQTKINTAFKVIADHIRAVTFAIADGVFPSNKDRGYVIRRLIRRACLYGKKLAIKNEFLYLLVEQVVEAMGQFYSYLKEKRGFIETIIFDEEKRFLQTLQQGEKLLNEIIMKDNYVSAKQAFKLFDSFGFPIELIEEEALNHHIKVDSAGFYQLLEQQKQLARNARTDFKAMQLQNELFTKLDIKSDFIGYEQDKVETKVVFMFKDNQQVNVVKDEKVYLILEQTPFYAEKGGQACDYGIISNEQIQANVFDVQQGPNKQHLHHVQVNGTLKVNDQVFAEIDLEKRYFTRKNHSATHLLHAAIREVLGTHAMQIGSYNDEQRLRIDISHNQPILQTQIDAIETSVLKAVKADYPCEIIYTDYDDAVNNYQAIAFFTEKYDQQVRIVRFDKYSCELCGGTHVESSKQVEDILITNIESKGAGVYRFSAISSHKTISEYLANEISKIKHECGNMIERYSQAKTVLKNQTIEDLIQSISVIDTNKNGLKLVKQLSLRLQSEFKSWSKQYENMMLQQNANKYIDLPIKVNNDINVLIYQFKNEPINTLKMIADQYRFKLQNLIVVLTSDNNQQFQLVVAVSQDLQSTYQANTILKKLTALVDGKGGGNSSLAQAGYKNQIKMQSIIDHEFTDLILSAK